MKTYFKRNTCRLCESLNIKLVMNYPATPVGDHFVTVDHIDEEQETYPLDLYFCNSCGQLQLLDVVNPEFVYAEYLYETSTSLGLVEHFQKYAEQVLARYQPKPQSLVVDIGCNDASFIRCFHEKGMSAIGVEPASKIAKKVQNSGVNVLNTFFSKALAIEIREEHGQASIISANNVMANVEDLGDFAEGLRELLAPDGIFVFESGYLVDLVRNCVIDNVYHEHLCYFRLNPLVTYFKLHGLEVIEIQHSPMKGGSLRGTVQRSGGSRPVSPAVAERMSWETSLGYDRARVYEELASRMAYVKKQLFTLLCNLKEQKKTIAGYGASVGVTTLLYYFGLSEILETLFDENPIKHNLYSPGHHIPVVSSEEIYNINPDYIVLLPWRYAELIMKKHQEYLRNGGHFIIPLPGVEII